MQRKEQGSQEPVRIHVFGHWRKASKHNARYVELRLDVEDSRKDDLFTLQTTVCMSDAGVRFLRFGLPFFFVRFRPLQEYSCLFLAGGNRTIELLTIVHNSCENEVQKLQKKSLVTGQ
ncbi:MAG: hypothetical protein EA392_08920 [Cryomorphaceae bacterium]|nr:MAG: hypothetical protein EA392_08920 [Cryomorphaceae bacterium]